MARRQKRGKGASSGPFVMLAAWLMDTPAWRTLPVGPRALYVELRRRFKGSNNGKVTLSHREAAQALAVHRNTVGPWFKELERRGFITQTLGYHLGPSGVGETTLWALDEEALDGMPPAKKFTRWAPDEIGKPRTENRTPRHKKQDSIGKSAPETGRGGSVSQGSVLKTVTAKG